MSNWHDLPTEEEKERIWRENERREQECAQRVAKGIVNLFRKKYEEVLSVFPDLGPFEKFPVYRNPDGGWQQVFLGQGSLSLKPEYIHHLDGLSSYAPVRWVGGLIFHRWIDEGGACDEDRRAQNPMSVPRFGYPEADSETSADGSSVTQVFEHGIIRELPNEQTEVATFDPTPRTLLGRWLAPFGEKNYGTTWMPKYRQSWYGRRTTKRWTPPA